MLYFFRVDIWHNAASFGSRRYPSKRYDAFNGFVVRIDHKMYYEDFYFVLDAGNIWQ